MLRLHQFGGPAGLQIDEVQKRKPGPCEVRLAIEAFALNYGDLYLMKNEYVFDIVLPSALCDEAVGVIDDIGEGVGDYKPGDRVSTLPFFNEGHQVSGETAVVPAEFITPYPEKLSNAEACSIWVQYLTAYYPIVELSALCADDWVLITAGASTSGAAALEICRKEGINTIATTRTETQFDYLIKMGATKAIVPGEDLAAQILSITSDKGVKTVYDAVGDPLMAKYSEALANNAHIFLYGNLDETPDKVPMLPMIKAAATLHPYSVYHHIYDPVQRERGVKYVTDALLSGDLNPQVDKVYPLEDFRAAYDYQLNAKGRRGKIVISTM